MTKMADADNEEGNTLGSKHCGLNCSISKQVEGVEETPVFQVSNPQVWATGQQKKRLIWLQSLQLCNMIIR